MLKAGIIGLGKMGLSHCAILNAQLDVELVGVCDKSKFLTWVLSKYGNHKCFDDYKKMIDTQGLDLVIVATPTKFHYDIVKYALEHDLHVFCEKPFCMNSKESKELVELANSKGLVNQVGYHNRFLGSFVEAKRLLDKGVIGDISHFLAEAYGPVVLNKDASTWRSSAKEGGGCLADYAAHVINIAEFLVKPAEKVAGSMLQSIFSKDVEDAVSRRRSFYNLFYGQISVNWSDETYRKMTTQVTVYGKNGELFVDQQEVRIFVTENVPSEGFVKGWNTKYITDITAPVNFYLRGLKVSLSITLPWHFICLKTGVNVNSFASALHTNEVTDMVRKDAAA